jgi:hypothetical protein
MTIAVHAPALHCGHRQRIGPKWNAHVSNLRRAGSGANGRDAPGPVDLNPRGGRQGEAEGQRNTVPLYSALRITLFFGWGWAQKKVCQKAHNPLMFYNEFATNFFHK